ncbi:DUF1194 domain-containing protein [Microvirga roseola]|uniref:DUF1194 domain-containing protein n=1 Tax=Microvirga roseola TaxID=2883126 RepID=UPI001E4CFFC8|nr:DUF1194 domain-containing protein [Microvirga roseola]
MLTSARVLLFLALSWTTAMFSTVSAWAETEVDLALVMAVDVSLSMEPDEQELQRQGFVEAFRAPEVHEAVRKGMLGRIAVVYLEWAGAAYQEVVVPWTVIEQPEDALGFADRLARSPTRRIGYTSVSGAIDFSLRQLRESGVKPLREVIDISGDGPNNQGRTVTQARDEALARGVTINGLPIMLKRPDGAWDIEDLDLYFQDCVIGGPGAFMVPVREKQQFIQTIRTKIVREIAGLSAPATLIQPAQTKPRANCLAGENRRGQRWRP